MFLYWWILDAQEMNEMIWGNLVECNVFLMETLGRLDPYSDYMACDIISRIWQELDLTCHFRRMHLFSFIWFYFIHWSFIEILWQKQAWLDPSISSNSSDGHTEINGEVDHVSIPNDGSDVWEIDVKHLQFGDKVASGSYGDLYVMFIETSVIHAYSAQVFYLLVLIIQVQRYLL